jgi:hypothetical protein
MTKYISRSVRKSPRANTYGFDPVLKQAKQPSLRNRHM